LLKSFPEKRKREIPSSLFLFPGSNKIGIGIKKEAKK